MKILSILLIVTSVRATPASVRVRFKTDVPGDFVINITSAWAPRGAERFLELLKDGFYDTPAAFFRVVPDFMVQFGISGTPDNNEKWSGAIQDDPVVLSNTYGTISYAARSSPNTRTTQVFVNFDSNKFLDSQGFAPFGKVVEGMSVLERIYNPTPGKQGGLSQGLYKSKGQAWIKNKAPQINSITSAEIEVDEMPTPAPAPARRRRRAGGRRRRRRRKAGRRRRRRKRSKVNQAGSLPAAGRENDASNIPESAFPWDRS